MYPLTICVTTACHDLNFLNPVVESLARELGKDFEHVHIQRPEDIDFAIGRISKLGTGRVVIFAHGRDGELLGADPSVSGEEAPAWLDCAEHHAALAGKEIFCLACQSQTLAANAIRGGAITFLGFAEVPFQRFDGDDPRCEPELEQTCKLRIAEATQLSLLRWLTGTESLVEVASYYRLCVRRITSEFARAEKEHPYRQGVIGLSLAMLDCSVRVANQDTFRG